MSNYAIQVPVDEVLEKLDHGKKWTQKAWSIGDKVCLHQGIRLCQYQRGDAYLIEQVAHRQGWGISFNDSLETTFDDVKQALVAHREVLPHELFEVFGPQWRQIVDMVRATALTIANTADGSWSSDTYDADAAARDAAARDAAIVVSFAISAINAADSAADVGCNISDSAYAARGITSYNLIGSTFTLEHYHALLRPWVAIHGPIDYTLTGPPTPEEEDHDEHLL